MANPINPAISTPFESKESITGAFGSAYDEFRPNRKFMLDEHEAAITGYTHFFMTTPPLNLDSGNLTHLGLNGSRGEIENKLVKILKGNTNGDAFMKILSNKFLKTSIEDEILEAKAAYNTYAGKSVKYAQSAEPNRFDQEFTVEYEETDSLLVTLIHKMWFEYASSAARGLIKRSKESQKYRFIDYAASAYIINTKPDGRTINFWSKFTGVFPKANNFSALNSGGGNEAIHLSIPYAASKVEHFDMNILQDFQEVASGNTGFNLLSNRRAIEERAKAPSIKPLPPEDSNNDYKVSQRTESASFGSDEANPNIAFDKPRQSPNNIKNKAPSVGESSDYGVMAYESAKNVRVVRERHGSNTELVLDFY